MSNPSLINQISKSTLDMKGSLRVAERRPDVLKIIWAESWVTLTWFGDAILSTPPSDDKMIALDSVAIQVTAARQFVKKNPVVMSDPDLDVVVMVRVIETSVHEVEGESVSEIVPPLAIWLGKNSESANQALLAALKNRLQGQGNHE